MSVPIAQRIVIGTAFFPSLQPSIIPTHSLSLKKPMSSQHSSYYTRTAQFLHWIMALIFIVAWLIGFYSGNFLSYDVDGHFKGDVITLHKNIATMIMFLLVIRLFWRYTHPAPKLPATMSPTMKLFAHLGHLGLYFMLIAIPVTGCLFSWSVGKPVPVLYLFELPRLVEKNPELLAIIKPLHIYLSWFAAVMIVGHVLAALKHHFIDKDNVLRSMTHQAK